MKEKVIYGKHVVIIMDLLGQTEMYKTLESLQNNTEQDKDAFQNKLHEFVRAIDYFKLDVDSFLEESKVVEIPESLSEKAKTFHKKANSAIFKTQRFSDGNMIFVPLLENEDAIPISSVMTILSCSGYAILSSLAKGNPIRCGVGLGGAAEIDNDELFGPAIGYAHHMESKVAIYPRIAVHPNVIDYLESFNQLSTVVSIENEYEIKISSLCKKMIKRDKDGVFILDYLGETLWDEINQDLVDMAFKFICSQMDIFHKEKRIFKKYKWLHKYFLDSGRVNT